MSPLTLGKLKRWQPAIESSRGSPDRCAEREYVQVRWRAAHEEISSARQLRKLHFFSLRWFFCPTTNSVRVTLRDSTAGPTGSPLFVKNTSLCCLCYCLCCCSLPHIQVSYVSACCVLCVICMCMCIYHYVIMHPLMLISPLSRYNVPI